MSSFDPNRGFLWRAQRLFFFIGVAYVVALVALCFPPIQRQVVFMHNFHWPLFATFDAPENHGLAPFKTVPFRLNTSDELELGAWYILSEPAYQAGGGSQRTSVPSEREIRQSLVEHPTVLFFHGNAASRAVKYRVQMYGQVTARLGANVLVIDYRGFADSQGTPTELGLNIDALAAWTWLADHGADPSNIIVMGHSLGTGVATKLVTQLGTAGVVPRALVLTSPFSSLAKVMETYSFAGVIPVTPLHLVPWLTKHIMKFIHTRYNTIDIIQEVQCPILLVHASNDMTIPPSHAQELFDKLIDSFLPPWPYGGASITEILSFGPKELENIRAIGEARERLTEQLVTVHSIDNFGVVKQFASKTSANLNVNVTFVQTNGGGHSNIVRWEGVIDFLG